MHDTDTAASLPPLAAHEENAAALRPTASAQPLTAAATLGDAKPRGLLARFAGFIRRLFVRSEKAPVVYMPDPTVADRAAVALAAQMDPPVAFRGDTANTLASPIGTYAGKPLEQALRKRAEQQFKNLDVTTATMN